MRIDGSNKAWFSEDPIQFSIKLYLLAVKRLSIYFLHFLPGILDLTFPPCAGSSIIPNAPFNFFSFLSINFLYSHMNFFSFLLDHTFSWNASIIFLILTLGLLSFRLYLWHLLQSFSFRSHFILCNVLFIGLLATFIEFIWRHEYLFSFYTFCNLVSIALQI